MFIILNKTTAIHMYIWHAHELWNYKLILIKDASQDFKFKLKYEVYFNCLYHGQIIPKNMGWFNSQPIVGEKEKYGVTSVIGFEIVAFFGFIVFISPAIQMQ